MVGMCWAIFLLHGVCEEAQDWFFEDNHTRGQLAHSEGWVHLVLAFRGWKQWGRLAFRCEVLASCAEGGDM